MTGCTHVDAALPCDDGDACTGGAAAPDTCKAGKCAPGFKLDCDDHNPCTTDSCDPAAKSGSACGHAANKDACNDGNACTDGDTCGGGLCLPGKVTVCDDSNPCTSDYCDPSSGCTATDNNAPCDDGDACTGGGQPDRCAGGACIAGPKVGCDDGDVCTDDACDKLKGCLRVHNKAGCDDGNACTVKDLCGLGVCLGVKRDCDDGSACTVDSCDSKAGCQYKDVSNTCDDGNPCTSDGCDKKVGCFAKANDKLTCTDGNPCTIDSCEAAKCVSVDKVCPDHACEAGVCDAKTGACGLTKRPDHTPCGDDRMCVAGQCKQPFATALRAGLQYNCALRPGGKVWCWGRADYGQLGNGSLKSSAMGPVLGLPAAASLTSGYRHSCAVLRDGTARCWGMGTYGQMGNNTSTSKNAKPVVVSSLAGASRLSAGSQAYHTCASDTRGGGVNCWGYNWNFRIEHTPPVPLSSSKNPAPIKTPMRSRTLASARRLGAVNTVIFHEDGSVEGDNTDAFGFMENLREKAPRWNPDGAVTVLGAGGAVRAVCAGLLEAGVKEIRLVNRSEEKTRELARMFGPSIIPVPWDEREASLAGISLLVNGTSLGMSGSPPLDMALDSLPKTAVVYDIVYAPLETPLLRAAKARENPVVDGLGMLIHQARPAFEAWFGVLPDVTPELREILEADLCKEERKGDAP